MIINTKILNGKRALITGATGGIGKAISNTLAESGCDLFLTASNDVALHDLENTLSKYDVRVSVRSSNLLNKEDVYNVVKSANVCYDHIDILINSAGIFPNVPIFEIDDELFSETINVNFRSAFIFTRELTKNMIDRQWGRIVNIGSSSAYCGFGGTSIYCASKHALLGFSRAIHDELKEHNVRTYFISPSSTKSKMGLATKGQDYSTFLDPYDVAKYVVFAISFDSNIMSEEIFLKRMKINNG